MLRKALQEWLFTFHVLKAILIHLYVWTVLMFGKGYKRNSEGCGLAARRELHFSASAAMDSMSKSNRAMLC